MSKKKTYTINGQQLTIDQIAERAFVSVAGIRWQLKMHKGDMQAVVDYYDERNSEGGGKCEKDHRCGAGTRIRSGDQQ